LVGETVGGRYTIRHVFADGVLARTYAGIDEHNGERCMIKVMYGDYAAVERQRQRFTREAEVGSRLCHPNVLAVVDAGETRAGLPFLVTVHVDGTPLSEIIALHAPLGTERATRLLADVCAGLAHIHERGFVHRSLSGDAILVTHFRDSEAAIIVDLGIAFEADAESTSLARRVTRAGKLVGAPAYMSPEQGSGAVLDQRADLYGLGVLLYTMLCGRLPFDGTAIELASHNLSGDVPLIQDRVPGLRVDQRLEQVASKLMRKNPSERFQTANELLHILEVPTLWST